MHLNPRKLITLRNWYSSRRRGDGRWALAFLLPSLLGSLVFVVAPIFISLLISFTDWRLASPLTAASLRENWVGWGNYRKALVWDEVGWSISQYASWRWSLLSISLIGLQVLMWRRHLGLAWGLTFSLAAVAGFGWWAGLTPDWSDRRFWQSLGNTFYFVGVSVPLTMTIALLLAVILNRPLRGIALYRTAFFMPVISGSVAISLVWRWIFNPTFGLMNQALALFGIIGPGWLNDKAWAMPALIITDTWSNVGFYMIIFLAGLQSVPQSLYEAADIEGANHWQKFWGVTIPLIGSTTFLNITLALIAAFQAFTLPYIMTEGGPAGTTRTLVHYMYDRAFDTPFRAGYGSAIAWLLFLILFILIILQWNIHQRWGRP